MGMLINVINRESAISNHTSHVLKTTYVSVSARVNNKDTKSICTLAHSDQTLLFAS